MADTFRVDAKNTSSGPHMLNAIPPVRVEAGQSAHDVEISKAEFESAKRFGVFEFAGAPLDHDGDGAKGGGLPALTGKNKAELLEIAKKEGVDIADDATNAQIVDAIETKRKG